MSEVALERPAPFVGLVRITRPTRLNALSNAVVSGIADAFATFEREDVRAVIVAGDARAFAAGADIAELSDPGPDLERWDRLWRYPIPTIAAVRGLALGGGLELAMSCDIMVVAENARLGQPEIRLGVMPGAGGTQRLIRALGKSLAMEMVLLAREIDGREALARGLASCCMPSERVEAVALDFAVNLAAGPPLALREAKRSLLAAFEVPLAEGLEAERAAFRRLLQTADGREGVQAFVDKRKATWTGT